MRFWGYWEKKNEVIEGTDNKTAMVLLAFVGIFVFEYWRIRYVTGWTIRTDNKQRNRTRAGKSEGF